MTLHSPCYAMDSTDGIDSNCPAPMTTLHILFSRIDVCWFRNLEPHQLLTNHIPPLDILFILVSTKRSVTQTKETAVDSKDSTGHIACIVAEKKGNGLGHFDGLSRTPERSSFNRFGEEWLE